MNTDKRHRARRPRVALLVVVVSLIVGALTAAGARAQADPAAATAAAKGAVKLKATIKKTAKDGKRTTVRARLEGSRAQLRGAKVELLTRRSSGYRLEDRARARTGKSVKLKWRAGGLGLVRVRVALVRGKRVLAQKSKRVFVVHRVRVLKPEAVTSVPSPGQPGPVTYSDDTKLRTGDIVATGIGPATPYGFLGVVDGNGSRGSASTKPTTLLEALAKGSISVSQDYEPRHKPVRSRGAGRGGGSSQRIPLKASVQCSGGAVVEVQGTATVTHGIEFDADWRFFSLDSARVEAFVGVDADLSASAEARASCTAGPVELARYALPSIQTFAGPIPIVITPEVVVTLEADGSVSARTTTGIHGSVEGRGGIVYDDGFSPTGSFTPSFEYSPPALSDQAHLGATLTPALDMLVYGLAGPELFLDAGLSLDAQPGTDPWWTLTAPIKVGARLTVPVLDLDSGDLAIYEDQVVLAQADSAPAPPTHRAVMTWDTNGSDVDLHIWDESGNHAWYLAQDDIPEATLSTDITDGFGPEVFSDQRVPADRRVRYGICYYEDHGAGPTTVTLDVTDPDGTIRTFTRRLSSDKDFALITTSPPGGGYTPSAGWCD